MSKRKILIGSPIRQKPEILKRFLEALGEMNDEGLDLDCLFVDDNTNPESSGLLERFAAERPGVKISPYEAPPGDKDDPRHHWKEETVWKVAAMKDGILSFAAESGYDHVFLVDSDLVLHPETLRRLADTGKDIVCAVYWTCWQPDTMAMPQVWLHGEYEHHPLARNLTLSDHEQRGMAQLFFYELRKPGLYEVGGLGACTLISRKAILAGARFAEIKNLSYWGEDRHFCVRAAALGFAMFVETTYPAFHIYRDSDLEGVDDFRLNGVVARLPEPEGAEPDLYRQASELTAFGYDEAAFVYFERIIADSQGKPGERTEAYLRVDAYYGRKGMPDKGRAILLDATKSLARAEIYCRLGAKCMDKEQWSEAIVWFKLAAKTARPGDWEQSTDATSWTWKPHIQLCVCYSRLGQLKNAYDHNEIGLVFKPDHPGMLSNREYLVGVLAVSQSE